MILGGGTNLERIGVKNDKIILHDVLKDVIIIRENILF